MQELLMGLFGGGTLVGIVTALIQYHQKQKGTDIDWYDRAIEQVKMQDDTIRQLREVIDSLKREKAEWIVERRSLKDTIEELEDLVNSLEEDKVKLMKAIGEYRKENENG